MFDKEIPRRERRGYFMPAWKHQIGGSVRCWAVTYVFVNDSTKGYENYLKIQRSHL